jgi:hypothetical protein
MYPETKWRRTMNNFLSLLAKHNDKRIGFDLPRP